MATRRVIHSTSRGHREKVVPIRVIRTPRSRGVTMVPSQPQEQSTHRPIRESAGNRRTLMWIGVIVVTAIIVVLWIGFLRSDFSRSLPPDSFLAKMRSEFSGFLSRLNLFRPAATNTNRSNPELDELRSRVFPTIKDQQFTTTNESSEHTNESNTNQ